MIVVAQGFALHAAGNNTNLRTVPSTSVGGGGGRVLVLTFFVNSASVAIICSKTAKLPTPTRFIASQHVSFIVIE